MVGLTVLLLQLENTRPCIVENNNEFKACYFFSPHLQQIFIPYVVAATLLFR